jgi:TonB-linked SusC/RagA family outer membrane protein
MLKIRLLTVSLAALFCAATAAAQNKNTVTGRVQDPAGNPLVGVLVSSPPGGNNIVLTDGNGTYSIATAEDDAQLQFLLVGYFTQTASVSGRSVVDITMKQDVKLIDELIVVGYGTTKRGNLTSAVESVRGDVLENRPITNIGEGLQGVIPNLKISPGGNAPGSGSSFNIRGYTSLNGGGPLILVDGVVQDPNMVNPNDIESVTVLKDAASAAIYGARAAYGVVLFTTKSGGKNQTPVVNFSSSWSSSSPLSLQHSMSALDYVNLMNLSSRNDGSGDIFSERQVNGIRAYHNDPVNNPSVLYDPLIETDGKYLYVGNTDWADEIYKNGAQQQYNVSVSGGSENSKYFASYGYLEQRGVLSMYNDKYQRHTANLTTTTDIRPWFTLGAKVKYTYGYEDHPSGGMSSSSGLNYNGGMLKSDLPPFMPVRHPDGSYAGQGSITNPIAVGELGGYDRRKVNDLWLTGNVVMRPLEGWTINADFTWNPYSYNQERVIKQFMEKRADGSEYIYPWVKEDGTTRTNHNDYYTALNVFTDYARSFGDHNAKITLGYNQEVKTKQEFWGRKLTLFSPNLPAMSLATGTQTTSDKYTTWAVQGVFGRLHYDYKEKYLVDFTLRYDGSSKFDKRFANLPSGSAAWYVSKENFMEGIRNVVSDLKVRVSYGSLGNQAVSGDTDFPYLPAYDINVRQEYIVGGNRGNTVGAPNLVSGTLTWERVDQFNLGVDFGLFDNRLSGKFDWFSRKTVGMLAEAEPLPGTLGSKVPKSNSADLKTVGWEFSIGWRDRVESIGLDYHASVVLGDAQGEITKYRNPSGIITTHYVGKKIGEIWGYESNGLFQSVEEIANAPSQSSLYGGTWYPGDVRYVDKDNNGRIDNGSNTVSNPGDQSIIGNATPRYEYGITLGAAWKGIDLEIFMQGVGKRQIWPDAQYRGVNGRWNVPVRDIESFWSEENPNGFLPRPYQSDHGNWNKSTRYLQNAAYLRLKQLSLGYTLPANWTQKIAISKVRVYFTGQNLLTWTKLSKLYDPEIVGKDTRDTNDVMSNMSYPIAKTFSFGVNLTL